MSRDLVFGIAGAVVGAAALFVALEVGGFVGHRRERPPARTGPKLSELRERIHALTKQRDRARSDLRAVRTALASASTGEKSKVVASSTAKQKAESEAKQAETSKGGPLTNAQVDAALAEFGKHLRDVFLGHGEAEKKKLREMFAHAPAGTVDRLLKKLSDTSNFMEKIVLAQALAQSGDPRAIQDLEDLVQNPDADELTRRTVASGLAFSDAAGVAPVLSDVAKDDKDPGTRANAAFGLARRGSEEGMSLYLKSVDDAFQRKDSAALQYLSGFFVLGDKILPAARQRLETYTDPNARLLLINLLVRRKDQGSIPVLRRISSDPSTGASVRKAATAALAQLQK